MNTKPELYRLPLYYDIAFTWDVSKELEFFAGLFAKHCSFPVRRILEPACGPGRLLRAFAERGYQVLGYDTSSEMVAFANQRFGELGLADLAQAVPGDMASFSPQPSFDAAINSINSIGYLLEDQDIISHFKLIAESLRPGGLYIVHCACAWDAVPPVEEGQQNEWTFERNGVKVTTCWWIEREDRLTRRSHHVCRMRVDDRGEQQVVEEQHLLRLWTFAELTELAARGSDFTLTGIYNEESEPIPKGTPITGELGNLYFVFQAATK